MYNCKFISNKCYQVVKEWKWDEHLGSNPKISARHFELAFQRVQPSVSVQERLRYSKVHELIKSGVGAIEALRKAFKNEESNL